MDYLGFAKTSTNLLVSLDQLSAPKLIDLIWTSVVKLHGERPIIVRITCIRSNPRDRRYN